MIRVLVADDQAAVRGGFAALIASEEEMQVAGEAANGREAIELARRLLPQVVLMDIRMPLLDGLEGTRLICNDPTLTATRCSCSPPSTSTTTSTPRSAPVPAASCSKTPAHRSCCNAIHIVAAGDALLAPTITKRLISEFAARHDSQKPSAQLDELTEREREILRLVAAGLNNAEIAARLVISPLTAKTHVSRILGKLDCRDHAQLVTLAYETGLVTPGDN